MPTLVPAITMAAAGLSPLPYGLPTSAAGFTFGERCEVELKELPGSCQLFDLQ